MSITVKQLPKSEVLITVEIGPEKAQLFFDDAEKALAKNISLKGFRKGKVPFEIAKTHIASKDILEKGAELAVAKTYLETVAQQKLGVVWHPQVRVTKLGRGSALVYEARVAVLPEVTLPDYTKITVKRREVSAGEGKETRERERVRREILEKLCAEADVEIPDILKERELDKMEGELKASVEATGMKFEDYLRDMLKKDTESLRKGWEEDAEKRIKATLVLRRVAERENIEASEEEVEERIKKAGEKGVDRENLKKYLQGVLRNEKVLDWLEEIATTS